MYIHKHFYKNTIEKIGQNYKPVHANVQKSLCASFYERYLQAQIGIECLRIGTGDDLRKKCSTSANLLSIDERHRLADAEALLHWKVAQVAANSLTVFVGRNVRVGTSALRGSGATGKAHERFRFRRSTAMAAVVALGEI